MIKNTKELLMRYRKNAERNEKRKHFLASKVYEEAVSYVNDILNKMMTDCEIDMSLEPGNLIDSDLEELVRNHNGKIEELEHRIKIIEQNLGISHSESIVTKSPEQVATEIKGKSPEAVLEIAKNFLKHDRYEEARSVLSAFIKDNPKNSYCGRMHFYVGKSYFKERNYQNAAKAYMESFEASPNGKKASKALYKLSECFMKLGKANQQKITLEKLAATFPQSSHGKKASAQLKNLKKSQNTKS